MNLRLTPLNILSSILLVSILYLFRFPDDMGFRALGAIPLIVMLVLSFFLDLVFRRLIRDLKRIWLFEMLFIAGVIILILIIQRIR